MRRRTRCYGFSTTYEVPSQKLKRRCYNALGPNKEGQVADIIDDSTCIRGMLDNLSNDDARLCLNTSYFEPNYVKTSQKSEAKVNSLDDRMITADQLRAKVCENNILSPQQQKELYGVLMKYQQHLTKRPGRCNMFEYEFKIEGDMPPTANSRPIPFALRAPVREQIQEMLRDGILEESYSAYVNPLTLVHREQKPIRICVDARRINKLMVADRVKVQPMRELLQRFHGSSYITSLDLSSAFLQVPLSKESRKWTAFQFQSRVYQFTSVPYGFKNSLSAFIRALETVLGDDEMNDHVITYVDDLLIHSSTFHDHLEHLDRAFRKLATAGFTINASKCNFCKPEIKFLGHIICDKTVKADPGRIEAILRYPVPKKPEAVEKVFRCVQFSPAIHRKLRLICRTTLSIA